MLHVSQPAISRVLALMESRLRFRLFDRSRSRLTPTAEARRLFAEVEQVYGGIQRVNELAASLAESGAGTLRLISSASFGQRMIPLALREFHAGNAHARVDYRSSTFDELAGHFLSGHADVAVSMQPPDHPNLTALELGDCEVVCIMPRGHALERCERVGPEDFGAASWIGYPANTPLGRVQKAFFASGLPQGKQGGSTPGGEPARPALVEVHSPVTAVAFVLQGLGPALVDAWCLGAEALQSVTVRPLTAVARIGIWATYSDLQPLPLMARRFLGVLRQVIEGDEGLKVKGRGSGS
jgi:DNA-binding transcriptional LysR family regulator